MLVLQSCIVFFFRILFKKVILKYNTPLPSSKPVKRQFSMRGAIFTKNRTDENF